MRRRRRMCRVMENSIFTTSSARLLLVIGPASTAAAPDPSRWIRRRGTSLLGVRRHGRAASLGRGGDLDETPGLDVVDVAVDRDRALDERMVADRRDVVDDGLLLIGD